LPAPLACQGAKEPGKSPLKPFGRMVPSVEAEYREPGLKPTNLAGRRQRRSSPGETSRAGNQTTPHSDWIMIFIFLSFSWEILKRPPFL
jgi:hypothetical protein